MLSFEWPKPLKNITIRSGSLVTGELLDKAVDGIHRISEVVKEGVKIFNDRALDSVKDDLTCDKSPIVPNTSD